MKKLIALILTLAMTMSLLAGCSTDTASDDTTSDGSASTNVSTDSDNTVTEGSNIEMVDTSEKPDGIVAGSYATYYAAADTVSTLIPGQYPGGRWAMAWIYDTLFYSPSGAWDDITGLLVTDWSLSEDGLTWTLGLTDQAYYTNGNPVDADSIIANFDYYLGSGGITNFADYGKIDEYSLWVTMTGQNSEFMQQFAVENVSMFDAETWLANTAAGMDTMEAFMGIGSGPYYVSDYELGTSLTFTANENYWCEDRYPSIETVYSPVIGDSSTQQTVLQSGDADAGIVTDWTVMENLVDNYGLNYVTESGTYRTLWFNTSGYSECLTDPVVRQALTMMVDMEEVSIALSGEYGAYGTNCFNAGVDYVHDYVYDPEGGLALLDSIGVDPADIELLALSDAGQSPIYSNVQAQLAECGVTLTFTEQDNSALMSAGMSGDWDLWAEHGGLGTGAYRIAILKVLSTDAVQKVVLDPDLGPVLADMVEEAFIQTTTEEQFDILEDVCAVASENYLYLGNLAVPTWHISNDSIVNYTLSLNGQFWMVWLSWMA